MSNTAGVDGSVPEWGDCFEQCLVYSASTTGRRRALARFSVACLAAVLGGIAAYVVLRLRLDYRPADHLARVAEHRGSWQRWRAGALWGAGIAAKNSLEYAVWLGVPVAALFQDVRCPGPRRSPTARAFP